MTEVEPLAAPQRQFSRILRKLSGQALAPASGFGIDYDVITTIALELKDVLALGVQLAMVIGAGNLVRGSESQARGMDRTAGDHMGMLGTVINALALQDALERTGITTRVMSA